ncbi:MAG: alpha/beta fold hydrolase [Puniceicoccales bacterium]|jgi:2-succinyl-6-hydroxy-2,4-cyclohexadiene-1-carboxylate synthase|nr:alpha/beta fold hydrolase [Puniceicoccales bacterium]
MASPQILALHGFTGDGTDFDALRSHCPCDWHWHCPPLPGHDGTDAKPEDASLDAHHRRLLRESDFFCADGPRAAPPVLLGYSMGGRIALSLALAARESFSALVLIGATAGIVDDTERAERRRADDALADALLADGTDAFIEQWWGNSIFDGLKKRLPPDALAALRARRCKHAAAGLAASLRGVGVGVLAPLWEKLPTLEMPVLCIAGSEDKKFAAAARAMAERLPNGTVRIIADAHHMPHLEMPEAVASALRAFAPLGAPSRTGL